MTINALLVLSRIQCKTTPATFQHWSDSEIMLFLPDNTSIDSLTVEEHLSHIEHFVQRFKEKGMKRNTVMCNLFTQEVEYLGGHLADKKEYIMDPENKKKFLFS